MTPEFTRAYSRADKTFQQVKSRMAGLAMLPLNVDENLACVRVDETIGAVSTFIDELRIMQKTFEDKSK